MSFGLYVHIPFCIKKCHYCDFLSFPATEETIERYCKALAEEISRTAGALTAEEKQTPVNTIFAGGGTPSILRPDQILALFSCINQNYLVDKAAEITLEANPGTFSSDKLTAWKEAGINRLSIGLQSTRDELLRKLGRIHSLKQFEEHYEMARNAGFDNINIDLISALPGQTLDDWIRTLKQTISYQPDHISAYSLIIEEGTPFCTDQRILDSLPDEDTDRRMYEYTNDILSSAGYHRYEISNYALEGKECRHNIGYWDGSSWLGFGLGAASSYRHARFSNDNNLKAYLSSPYIPFDQRKDYELQTKTQEMEDRMIFGLRMMSGVSRPQFEKDYGVSMDVIYGSIIEKYRKYGLLEEAGGRIRLTPDGIDVSNRIFEDFIL